MTITYTIYNSKNEELTGVEDGELDTTTTSIALIGKNYAGYGNVQNQNFVHMLENFSSPTAPLHPLVGQLWWDFTNKLIKVCTYGEVGVDPAVWKVLSQSAFQPTAPTSPQAGDVWFDTTNQQLNVYNGSTWVLVGPSYNATQGVSGVLPFTVWDTEVPPNAHTVLEVMSGGVAYAVWSKDASFTLAANSAITGFTTLSPGLTLSTVGSNKINGYATLDSPVFVGTPQAPSPANNDTSANIATAMFVSNLFTNLADGVVANLNTLNELAQAINNDSQFGVHIYSNIARIDNTVTTFVANVDSRFSAVNLSIGGHETRITNLETNLSTLTTTVNNINSNLNNYVLIASMPGYLAPYALDSTVSAISTTVYSDHAPRITALENAVAAIPAPADLSPYARLASPIFTGNPQAPTAGISDNSTSIATTSFVKSVISSITGWAPIVSTSTPTGGNNGDFWFQI